MVLVVKNPPANAEDIRHTGLIPGPGRVPGGGHGNPLQYSCLEKPMDRGAWWATVRRVTKSQTWLKRLSMQASKEYFVFILDTVLYDISLFYMHNQKENENAWVKIFLDLLHKYWVFQITRLLRVINRNVFFPRSIIVCDVKIMLM